MGIPNLIDAPWQEILKTIETTSKPWENFIGGQLDLIRGNEPFLQAWALVDSEGALLRARQIDQTPTQAGFPLLGMPIGIKDIFDLKGFPTRAGIDVWTGKSFALCILSIIIAHCLMVEFRSAISG
jgi:Asp-tRNA(Asn)/Glu-tRNA(Gln) amidotransferase A subunit family amidase